MRISFAHPELALLALAALALIGLAAVALVMRRRALSTFGGQGARLVSASPTRQVAKLALVSVAALAIAVALVGPQIGETQRRGTLATIDTVIALDVSQSMAVRDVAPDRLRVARRAVELIGPELAGGRVGLTLFAGTSVVRYPLTADTKIVGAALDASGHGFRITPGSSLAAAVQGAAALFPTGAEADERPKAIVIVSDGEDLSIAPPALPPLAERNIRVFTLGIGTPEGGPVPVYDSRGQFQQMLVNANGTQITSRLDEARLRAIAEQGGGQYFRYDGEAAAGSVAEALRAIETRVVTTEGGVTPENRYQIFLGIALLALIADWLLDERRRMPRPRVPRATATGRRRLLGTIGAMLILAGCAPGDPLADEVDKANEVYARDPAAALARYRDLLTERPTSPEIAINLANTLVKLNDPDRALVEYGRALDNAEGATRAIAFYNRGNALFALGRLGEARASYVETLRLDPSDRDAKFNIEVIDRIAEEMGGQPSNQQPSPGPGSPRPGASPSPAGASGPSGASGSTGPVGGSPPPGGTGATGPGTPESVESALGDFRANLTVEEALQLLDALRNEQRGLPALIEGTGIRRGGNLDVPY